MRAILQRVSQASVCVEGSTIASIQQGYLALLGIHAQDQPQDADKLIQKMLTLRLFNNEAGKPDLSIQDIDGEILLVSQFTLYANTQKGRRPSFTEAAPPDLARTLYEDFCQRLSSAYSRVCFGEFGAMMSVSLVNEGPFTIDICS